MVMVAATLHQMTKFYFGLAPDGWWVSLYGYRITPVTRWSWWKFRHITQDVQDPHRTELTERVHTDIALHDNCVTSNIGSHTFILTTPGVYDRLAIHSAEHGPPLDMCGLADVRDRPLDCGDQIVASNIKFTMT